MGAGHPHHGHDSDDGDLAVTIRRGLTIAVAAVAALALVAVVIWWPRGDAPELNPGGFRPDSVDATVESVTTETCTSLEVPDALDACQRVRATVTSGPTKGDSARFALYETDFDKPNLKTGDRIVLLRNPAVPDDVAYSYLDFQRSFPMIWLVVLFVIVVVALGRWKGVRALAGIAISFAVLLAFLLPSLLRGNPAVPVALAATVLIAFGALYLAHGFSARTTVALVGTLVSLGVIVVLALVFVSAAQLTGLADDDATILRVTAGAIDLRGLLVAGIVVGALGVLDDVTVTQVSVAAELRRARPDARWTEIYRSAVDVGRDHIASTVNTLVLAYAGASLPLLILFFQADQPWSRVVTGEVVAVEVIRALVGSIGLVLAVPVTTALAAIVITPSQPSGSDDDSNDHPPATPHAPNDTSGVRASDPRWDDLDFTPQEKPF